MNEIHTCLDTYQTLTVVFTNGLLLDNSSWGLDLPTSHHRRWLPSAKVWSHFHNFFPTLICVAMPDPSGNESSCHPPQASLRACMSPTKQTEVKYVNAMQWVSEYPTGLVFGAPGVRFWDIFSSLDNFII